MASSEIARQLAAEARARIDEMLDRLDREYEPLLVHRSPHQAGQVERGAPPKRLRLHPEVVRLAR